MKSKKSYLKQNVERRMSRMDRMLKLIIFIMAVIVLFDSFNHGTPLYYIGFYFGGLLLGRVIVLTMRVEHDPLAKEFILKVNKWDILITLTLLLLRFVFGLKILEHSEVFWASDALYLFFIGVYRSKLKGLVRQIDEIVYQRLSQVTN